MKKLKLFSLFLLANLIGSSMAAAASSITVTYQPLQNATSVPTLSGAMLVVLAILLATVAFRMLKQHQSGSTMLLGVLGVTALMSGAGGVKLLSDAQAGLSTSVLSVSSGGSITVQANGGSFNFFENSSGVTLRITDVSTDDANACPDIATDFGLGPGMVPHCAVGSALQPDAQCYVLCLSIDLP